MKISNDELLVIMMESSYRIHTEIRRACKAGKLEQYLNQIGMADLIPKEKPDSLFESNPDGKVIVFGDSQIKEQEIFGCLKELGLQKERLELHLGYDELKTYPFRKLQYNPNYRLILVGPLPHSTQGKEDFSSVIANMEQTDGYTKVIRLTDAHQLKITKTNLKRVIEQELHNAYLAI